MTEKEKCINLLKSNGYMPNPGATNYEFVSYCKGQNSFVIDLSDDEIVVVDGQGEIITEVLNYYTLLGILTELNMA